MTGRKTKAFYSVMAARDTAGEMCWKCLHKPAADEPPTTGSGKVLIGAEGAEIGHQLKRDV